MNQKKFNSSPRIKVIQKLYNSLMNPDALIDYPKSQYKKFIKDVVTGTLERSNLIEEQINSYLSEDIDLASQKERILQKIESINKQISNLNNKLKNKAYVTNAPKEIVQNDKNLIKELAIEDKKLRSIVSSIN